MIKNFRLIVLLCVCVSVFLSGCSKKEKIKSVFYIDKENTYINQKVYKSEKETNRQTNLNFHFVYSGKRPKDITCSAVEGDSDNGTSLIPKSSEFFYEDFAEEYEHKGFSVGNILIKTELKCGKGFGSFKLKSIKLKIDNVDYQLSFKDNQIKYDLCNENEVEWEKLEPYAYPSYLEESNAVFPMDFVANEDLIIDKIDLGNLIECEKIEAVIDDSEPVSEFPIEIKKGSKIHFEFYANYKSNIYKWSNVTMSYGVCYHLVKNNENKIFGNNIIYLTLPNEKNCDDFVEYMLKNN